MAVGREVRLVTVLLAVPLLVLTGCTFGSGPLEVPPDHGYGGVTVDLDATFTDAFEVIFVPGDQPVTITKIELINTTPGLKLVDVQIAGGDREQNFQFEPVYPPVEYDPGPLVPAVGAVLLPASQQTTKLTGYEIIMAIKVMAIGIHVRGGYRVEYTVGGINYAYDARAEITVCTPDWVEAAGGCEMAVPDD